MAENLTRGDIKFYYDGTTADKLHYADMRISGYDLYRDPGFETEVLIRLFTDARAKDDDKLLNKTDTRRGWWADFLFDNPLGSRLWLLFRSKINDETLSLAELYTKEALNSFIVEGKADEILATAVRGDTNQINIIVQINKTTNDSVFFKFFVNWEEQIMGGLN